MAFQYKKTVTYWLSQAAKSHRVSFGQELSQVGLHAGQELILKILATENGQTMGSLANALGVQPPTVTKTVTRLTAQGFLERRAAVGDARQSLVFITEQGLDLIRQIDKTWKRLERRALDGLDDKERRNLRKLLKKVEKNISKSGDLPDDDEDEDEENTTVVKLIPENF